MLAIPKKIREMTEDRQFALDQVGMSGSNILIYEDMVLKIQPDGREAENELCIMKWLQDKLPVPRVLCHEKCSGQSYLLMTKVPGDMVCSEEYMQNPELMVHILAEGLEMLWGVDVSDCPCSNNLDAKLQMAEFNVKNGLVDMDNVEPETFGKDGFESPEHLLEWLKANRPPEEIVFSHGDFCLPNLFAAQGRISGFIDLGRAGIADRWQDIALVYRSMLHNYSGKYGGRVYEGVGAGKIFEELRMEPDYEKIRYYILMDELF